MAYNLEEIKSKLDSCFSKGPEEESPVTADIIKQGKDNVYSVRFLSKDKIIKYTQENLSPQESFDIADKTTAYLKSKGYACTVELDQLPTEFKENILGIKKTD